MLHYETVEPDTLGLLKILMQKEYLQEFVLVGGTSLALQLGHRRSVDIDLFTLHDFQTDQLIPLLLHDFELNPVLKLEQTLVCILNGIKTDFIRFKYPFIRPILEEDGIRMAQIEDIAPMKLDAISGRGRKKDFYDLYFIMQYFSFEKLFSLFLEKYPHQTTFHVVKSITYFADAEKDPDPMVFDKNVTWTKVKNTIENEIRKL